MTAKISIKAAAGTHTGRVRSVNQDNVLAYIRSPEMGDALGFFIVADGMGGYQAGEIASQMAVETIREALTLLLDEDDSSYTKPGDQLTSPDSKLSSTVMIENRLMFAIEEANRVIFEYGQANPIKAANLGCTTTCAIVRKNIAVIANVGDSRTYRLRGQDLEQITDDHSYVGQLVRKGHLNSDEIFDHPQRNVITRALGSQPDVLIDIKSHELEPGDRLLLCSDGLWEMIRDREEIAHHLQAETLEDAVSHLIDAANSYGGTDNIGVVVAEYNSIKNA